MTNPKNKPKTLSAKLLQYRVWIQTAFLMLWLDPLSLRLHGFCSPVFHCYSCPLATFACPIGVVANYSALHIIPFAAIAVLIIFAVILGSFVCGWLCPFGFAQDLAAKIPTKKLKLPLFLGYTRYAVLAALVLLIPFFFGKDHPLFICSVCPVGAIEGAGPNIGQAIIAGEKIIWPNAVKIAIVLLLLIAILFKNRPWCTLLCPLGAFFGIFNRFSLIHMRVDPKKCTHCGYCEKKSCSYGLNPETDLKTTHCIRCMDCSKCPSGAIDIDSSIKPKSAKKKTAAKSITTL